MQRRFDTRGLPAAAAAGALCLALTFGAASAGNPQPAPADLQPLAGEATITIRSLVDSEVLIDGRVHRPDDHDRPAMRMEDVKSVEIRYHARPAAAITRLHATFAFDGRRELMAIRPLEVAEKHDAFPYAAPRVDSIDHEQRITRNYDPEEATLVVHHQQTRRLSTPTTSHLPMPWLLLDGGLADDFDRWVNRAIRPGSGDINLAPYFELESSETTPLEDGRVAREEWHVAEGLRMAGGPMRVGRRLVSETLPDGSQRVVEAEFAVGDRMHSRWLLDWTGVAGDAVVPAVLRVHTFADVEGEPTVSREVMYRFHAATLTTDPARVAEALELRVPPDTEVIER